MFEWFNPAVFDSSDRADIHVACSLSNHLSGIAGGEAVRTQWQLFEATTLVEVLFEIGHYAREKKKRWDALLTGACQWEMSRW